MHPKDNYICPRCGGHKCYYSKVCWSCTYRGNEITDNGDGTSSVQLGHGLCAIIDTDDAPLVAPYRWYAKRSRADGTHYAVSTSEGSRVRMHRLVSGCPPHLHVDHIDHDGLNNRRSNLRWSTHHQNQGNRLKQAGRTSRYKGVSWSRGQRAWVANICSHGRRMYLGHFRSEIDAAKAYDAAAREVFGPFALTNFPNNPQTD